MKNSSTENRNQIYIKCVYCVLDTVLGSISIILLNSHNSMRYNYSICIFASCATLPVRVYVHISKLL